MNNFSNISFKFAIVLICFFLTINCKKEGSNSNTVTNQQSSSLTTITTGTTQIVKVTGKPCPKVWYDAEKENPRCVKLTVNLINAATTGDTEGIKNALEAGANIDASVFEIYPALIQAAAAGQKDSVNLLLDNGADVNRSLTFGNCPMLKAVESQNPEIVKILIERGANVCPTDLDGATFWQRATWYEKNQEIADLLKQAGGDKCQ